MSKNIDKRIVEMSFENEKFEKGIKNSKNSLREFTDAIEKSDSKKSFSGLTKSLGDMSSGFSALEQVAIGALRKIGAEAVSAGARVVKSIAIEPITQGFQELELKMDSTKTIMASTGESLEVVNEKLNELNHYSDRTIYSFSDMTQNIGKFTNAGVKLDMAVASIQGVANAAALAGANSNEASRAMYNFAQALSAGSVKLIDWKSIENANMATVGFKQELIDSAVAAGTLTKTVDGMYKVVSTKAGSKGMADPISATRYFNESLQHQWMTTEVLTQTLARYADETTEIGRRAIRAATEVNTFTKLMDTLQESVGSGWAQTFELIFGDFEESKALWTGINDAMGAMIGAISDARNAFLEGGLSTGWKQFTAEGISSLKDFENTLAIVAGNAGVNIDELVVSAGSMEGALKENWLTGEILADTVNTMADNIKDLSEEELKNAGYTAKSREELLTLRDALLSGAISAEEFAKKMSSASGRENIIEGLKNSVIALITVLKPIAAAWDQIFPPTTAARLYDITESFKNFTAELRISETTADKLQRTFAGVFAVLDILKQALTFAAQTALSLLNVFIPIGDTFLDVTARIGDFVVGLAKAIENNKVFSYALLAVKIGVLVVAAALSTAYNHIKNFVVGLLESHNPIEYLANALSRLGEIAGNVFRTIYDWVKDKFSLVTTTISEFAKLVTPTADGFNTILDVLKSLATTVGEGLVTAFVKLKDILSGITFDKIAKFIAGGMILLLVHQVTKATKGFADLTASASSFLKAMKNNLAKNTTIKELATSIALLAVSIWLLSTIPAEKAKNSLITLALGVGVLVGVYALLRTIEMIPGGKDKMALSFASIGAGILAMVGVLKVLSLIDSDLIRKALPNLAALTGIMAAIQVLMGLAARIGGGNKLTTSLASVAGALLGILAVVGILAFVPDEVITKGFVALTKLGAILVSIELFLGLAARIGGGKGLATSLTSTTLALAGMVGIIMILNTFTDEQFDKGLSSLTKIMTLVTAMQLLSAVITKFGGKGAGLAKSILHLVAVAGVVAILAASLIKLSQIEDSAALDAAANSLSKVITAVGILAAGMGVLTAIGAGVVPALVGLLVVIASLAAIVLAFVGLAWLMDQFDSAALARGFEELGKVATAIGNFIGNIFGGIAEGALERAGIGLAVFFDSISGIDVGAIGLLAQIADAFLNLSLAGFVDVLSGKSLGGSAAKFAKELEGLITTLKGLELDGIDDATTNLQAMTPMLGDLEKFVTLANKIPNSGISFASGFVGDNKIDDFVLQLANIVYTFKDIDTTDVDDASAAIEAMNPMLDDLEKFVTLANKIQNSGLSVASFFVGDNTLDGFGTELAGLVEAFKDIEPTDAEEATMSVQALLPMVTVLDKFAELGQGLSNNGLSFVSFFVGDNTLDGFGEELAGLVEVFTAIEPADAAKATMSVQALLPMVNTLRQFSSLSIKMEDTKNNGLKGLANQLKSFVATIIKIKWDDAKEAFENLKSLGNDLATIANITISSSTTSPLIKSLTTLLDSVTAKILSYGEVFRASGKNIFDSFKISFTRQASQESLIEIGNWIPQSIANGILDNISVVTDAGVKIGEELETAIRDTTGVHSESDDVYVPIGQWITKSLGTGIESLKGWLLDKAGSLGMDLGDVTTGSISESLTSGEGIVSKGLQALFDKLTGETTDLGEGVAESLTKAFQDSISNVTTGLAGSETEKKIKTALEKLQDYISEEKYYSRISLREELDAYKELQATYAAGSEERMKIDREVYRLEKEIYESQKKYIEDVTKAQKDAAEQRKTLEIDFQKNLSSIYKQHQQEYTRIVQEAEAQRQQIRENYAQKQQEINNNLINGIRELTQAYDDAVKSRTDAIAGTYGLFDEVTKGEGVSGEQLLENLRSQVVAIKDWDEAITSLASRGITGALLEELQKMGPSATEQLQGLLALSDTQLNEYVALFNSKYSLARTSAESELIALKNNTSFQIYDLRVQAEKELIALESSFSTSLNNIDNQMNTDLVNLNLDTQAQVDELKAIFDTSLEEINTSLAENLTTMKTGFAETMSEIDGLTVEELEKLNIQFAEQIAAINAQIDADLDTMAQTFAETGQDINAQTDRDLTTLKDNYSTSGATAVTNLAAGILSELSTAENAAQTLVNGVLAQLEAMIDGFYEMGAASAAAYSAGMEGIGSSAGTVNVGALSGISGGGSAQDFMDSYAAAMALQEKMLGGGGSSSGNSSGSSDAVVVERVGSFNGVRWVDNIGGLGSTDMVRANTLSVNNLSVSALPTTGTSQNGSKTTDISYTQNNYSPKALSRLEIYRDTKTQLATLKEAVSQI